MKKIVYLIFINILVNLAAGTEMTGEADKQTRQESKTYALIVGGISKDERDRLDKSKVISNLHKLLTENLEISMQNLRFLVADDLTVNKGLINSSADNIQKTIDIVKNVIKPEDRFIFYYLGQANIVKEQLRFNLPGLDITQKQLAEWIKAIDVSSILIVLDCPGSGLAAKALSGQNRIVICSCTEQQRYSTHFGEYFISALTDTKTDTNMDGKISILEAFTMASRQIDDWYRQKKLLTTEIPVLEDDGDGIPSKQPWKYKIDNMDGEAASEFFLMP
jgi:hypothetical protein